MNKIRLLPRVVNALAVCVTPLLLQPLNATAVPVLSFLDLGDVVSVSSLPPFANPYIWTSSCPTIHTCRADLRSIPFGFQFSTVATPTNWNITGGSGDEDNGVLADTLREQLGNEFSFFFTADDDSVALAPIAGASPSTTNGLLQVLHTVTITDPFQNTPYTFDVAYQHIENVPEPSSLALVALALIGAVRRPANRISS